MQYSCNLAKQVIALHALYFVEKYNFPAGCSCFFSPCSNLRRETICVPSNVFFYKKARIKRVFFLHIHHQQNLLQSHNSVHIFRIMNAATPLLSVNKS